MALSAGSSTDAQLGAPTATLSAQWGILDLAPLPPRPQVFHGREKEVQRLASLVVDGGPVRVGIIGPGGIGKTTLAVEVLHEPRVRARFSKDRLFISCEGATSTESVLNLLAIKLGVDRSGGDLLSCTLAAMRAREHMLILLDNFETIWSPTDPTMKISAELLLAQLVTVDGLSLILTTRGNVLPLAERIAWANSECAELDTLSSTAALQMFEDLTLLEPGVLAATVETSALTELLREIDFLPLAVMLLARLNDLPSRLLREWSEVLTELLEADYHDGTRRELSVEVSIRISLAHLPQILEPHQLLSMCGLLPAGLFPDRLQQLRAFLPHIDSAAAEIVRHSLVYRGSRGELKMLSPIRHYVRAHLVPRLYDLAQIQRVYIRLVNLFPSDQNEHTPFAAAQIQHEYPNVLAVLGTMVTRPTDILLTSIMRLSGFAMHRGLELPLWAQLLPHLTGTPIMWEAACRMGIAQLHRSRNELDEALCHMLTAADLVEQSQDPSLQPLLTEIYARTSRLYHSRGELPEAEYALGLASGSPDQRSEILAFDQRTDMMVDQGNCTVAVTRARTARDEAFGQKDEKRAARTTMILALALEKLGDYDAAFVEWEAAHALYLSSQPEGNGVVQCKLELAILHLRRNGIDKAEELLIESYAINTLLNDRTDAARITLYFAILRAKQGLRTDGILLVRTAVRLLGAIWLEEEIRKFEARALQMIDNMNGPPSKIM